MDETGIMAWIKTASISVFVMVIGWIWTGNQKIHKKIEDVQDKSSARIAALEAEITQLKINTEVTKTVLKSLSKDMGDIKKGMSELLKRRVK